MMSSEESLDTERSDIDNRENESKNLSNDDIDNDNKLDTQEVTYKNSNISQFNETRALFIANLNLVPEFDTEKFKDILSNESKNEGCNIERAWLNGNCSHCYVLVSDTPGAIAIRNRLNGKDLAENKDDKNNNKSDTGYKIFVDFIPVRAMDNWIEQEQSSPSDAVWELTYTDLPSKEKIGTRFKAVSHKMINYPNTSVGYVGINRPFKKKRYNSPRDIYTSKPRYDITGKYHDDRKNGSRAPKSGYTHSSHIRTSDTYVPNYSRRSDKRGSSRVRDKSEGRHRDKFKNRADVYIPKH